MASIIFLVCLCGLLLFFLGVILLGFIEMITAHRLRKHGETGEGQLQDIDLKGRGRVVYGKVKFTYHVNDVTYTKKQTVDKNTALAFLADIPALPRFAEPKKVTVLFLPRRPSVARLVAAPSDYMRIFNCVVMLIVLGSLVALMLCVIFSSMNQQPNY